jgi:hypothetical protein
MPSIIKGSISILSDAGLGMAMFSLGTRHWRFDICSLKLTVCSLHEPRFFFSDGATL